MLIQSMIIAFSMYSKIPMPRVEWNKKNMKYTLCFFPLIGIVIGLVMYGGLWLLRKYQFGLLFTACAATVIPVLITGGIHLDGYLDTIDALSSYGDREKRLEILKDSNSGAFAIIFGLVYFVLSIGIWSEINFKVMPFVAVSYVMSRTLSGFSVAAFPLAKNTGLAATFHDGAHRKHVKMIMAVYFIIEAFLLLWMDVRIGSVAVIVYLIVFAYYYRVCKKIFGGVTGDLAGFFLQICELAVLAALMVTGKILF